MIQGTARVRDARVEDAEAIGAVSVASWRAAYAGLMSDALLASLSADERAADWRRSLAALAPRTRAFVAEDDAGRVVGFASVGPSRDEVDGDLEAELYNVYLVPEAWGRGIGRALLGAAIAHAAEVGFRALSLWVHADNARARRFYEAAGMRAGERMVKAYRGEPLPHLRYELYITSPPSTSIVRPLK